jgi:hypothetical protein
MVRRKNIDVQKMRGVWLVFFSPLFPLLQQAIAQTSTTATKTTNSNAFLTYENNSTLGIKIQYPSNWQQDSYNNKVAFFAPSTQVKQWIYS